MFIFSIKRCIYLTSPAVHFLRGIYFLFLFIWTDQWWSICTFTNELSKAESKLYNPFCVLNMLGIISVKKETLFSIFGKHILSIMSYEHLIVCCSLSTYEQTSIFWNLSWLQIESYIKESMKREMTHLQQSAVHNHTAAMLEMGTNLLSQTAEQTRKLTDVETQVPT